MSTYEYSQELFYGLLESLGPDYLLSEIECTLSTDELIDLCEYIARNNDICIN